MLVIYLITVIIYKGELETESYVVQDNFKLAFR